MGNRRRTPRRQEGGTGLDKKRTTVTTPKAPGGHRPARRQQDNCKHQEDRKRTRDGQEEDKRRIREGQEEDTGFLVQVCFRVAMNATVDANPRVFS